MPISSILVVDDEPQITETLSRFLKMKGFTVYRAGNGAEALEIAAKNIPDVVLSDIRMPGMDGIECLKHMKERYPETEVIMATAIGDLETGISCLQAGAFGYLMKPLDLQAVYAEVNRALEHRSLVLKVNDYQKNLEQKVDERTKEIQLLNTKLKDNFLKSVRMLIGLIETYDPFIGGHLRRVAALVRETGKRLKLSPKDMLDLEMAALLHDIGTVSLPKKLKETPFAGLTAEEVSFVKQHTVFAQNILSPMGELANVGAIIRSHLEHLDGSGFPDGLLDEKIPLCSRILGVVNAFDELVSRRRFTMENLASDEAREEFAFKHLYSLASKHFQRNIIKNVQEAAESMNLKVGRLIKVPLNKLKPGMVVAKDIHTNEGTLLLAKGFTLDQGLIKQLSTFCEMDLVPDDFRVLEGP